MTKKRNFTAFMIAIMVMLFSLPANAQGKVGYVQWFETEATLTFKGGDSVPVGDCFFALNTDDNDPGWVSEQLDCTKLCIYVVFDESFKDVRPTSCYRWFYRCFNLAKITGIENLNTDEVTNMRDMFYNCSRFTSLDDVLSNFNTDNVTDMSYMFSGCSGLTSINLSNFNTDKVTGMASMFENCKNLTDLNLSNFNTAEVKDMEKMFYYCKSLTSLNLSNFNTDKVRDMSQMFQYCSGLNSLVLSSFNTANVTSMSQMFQNCSGLGSLDVSNFNTANVTTMSYMFNYCPGLTSLDLSSFNTAKVQYMMYMFKTCSGLKTIYVSDDFTTVSVRNGDEMFSNCTSLAGAVSYDPKKTRHSMANYKTGYFKTYFTLGDSKVELCGEQLTTNSLNLNLTGDNDFVAHAPFTANTATYSRDLSTSNSTWFSLCLPFAYTPQNFTAYQLQSASADAVEIGEISGEIAAGMPVLFKFKDGADKKIEISAQKAEIVKAPVDGTTVSGPGGSSLQLCGTYQNKSFSEKDGNAFILLNNKLMNPAKMLDTGVTKVGVKPFRAYMTLTASAPAQQASARAFSIGLGGEGNEGTTAIDLLKSVATDDAEYYDINGRRIDAPAKGVNIVRRGNKTIKLIIK